MNERRSGTCEAWHQLCGPDEGGESMRYPRILIEFRTDQSQTLERTIDTLIDIVVQKVHECRGRDAEQYAQVRMGLAFLLGLRDRIRL